MSGVIALAASTRSFIISRAVIGSIQQHDVVAVDHLAAQFGRQVR